MFSSNILCDKNLVYLSTEIAFQRMIRDSYNTYAMLHQAISISHYYKIYIYCRLMSIQEAYKFANRYRMTWDSWNITGNENFNQKMVINCKKVYKAIIRSKTCVIAYERFYKCWFQRYVLGWFILFLKYKDYSKKAIIKKNIELTSSYMRINKILKSILLKNSCEGIQLIKYLLI